MRRTARILGLTYSPTDPFGIETRVPLPLFGYPGMFLGKSRPRDLMFGLIDDLPICLFDLTLDVSQMLRVQASGPTRRSESEDRWIQFESSMREDDAADLMCAIVQVDLDSPTLRVEPTLFPGLVHAVSPSDIRSESGSFNERFNVHCRDRRFASAILDARMLRLLLDLGTAWAVEVCGSYALLYGRRSEPKDRSELVAAARAFVDTIPRAVHSLYPPEPERMGVPWSLPSPPA